jgi:hypothetical protein
MSIYPSPNHRSPLCSRRFCTTVELAQVPLCDAVFEYLISPAGKSSELCLIQLFVWIGILIHHYFVCQVTPIRWRYVATSFLQES